MNQSVKSINQSKNQLNIQPFSHQHLNKITNHKITRTSFPWMKNNLTNFFIRRITERPVSCKNGASERPLNSKIGIIQLMLKIIKTYNNIILTSFYQAA